MPRSLAVAAVAAVAAFFAALPAGAVASTVAVDGSGVAVFRSGPQNSDVTTRDGGAIPTGVAFYDALQAVTAGPGCSVLADAVVCTGRDPVIRLEAGNDRYAGRSSLTGLTVYGGPGADDLRPNGMDSFAYGGSGPDTIAANANSNTVAHGDSGDDHVRGSGAFVEVSGGAGDDLVAGSGAYDSTVSGDAGDDDVIVLSGAGTASGGPGMDTIVSGSGAFDFGSWNMVGGAGADTIVQGARGGDVSGGAGDDLIDVSAGGEASVSVVSCGAGQDVVYAGPEDQIAADCEIRRSGPMPPSAAVERALAHYANAFPTM